MTQIDSAAPATQPDPPRAPREPGRIHPAWWVALVSFLTILGAGAFTAAPGLLIEPLHAEFGWSRSTIGLGITVQLVLYGLIAPFSAAFMDRFGIRPVVSTALTAIAIGSFATIWMSEPWHFMLTWGVIVGIGSGSLALAFTATVTQRWFVRHRGLVSGVLTAATASGQLIFLPVLAWLVEQRGWPAASVTVALACAVVMPLVLLLLREHPADAGLAPYGSDEFVPKPPPRRGAAQRAVAALWTASRTPTFWLLVGAFAICGATTNGLVRTHFVPSAHDHGMGITVAASLLAVIGVFDVVGTIFSGWLTDRYNPRLLLAVYYTLRGVSLLFLPTLMAPEVELPMIFFIVFYGLDWVATVPPTLALCREIYADDAPVVFGWVLASHQVGAGIVAWAGGLVRDSTGSYDLVWYGAGVLCAGAALMSIVVRRTRTTAGTTTPDAVAH